MTSRLLAALAVAAALAGCLDGGPVSDRVSEAELTVPPIIVGWDPTWRTLLDPALASVPTWPATWGDDSRPGSSGAVVRLDAGLVTFYRTRANRLGVVNAFGAGFVAAVDGDLLAAPAAAAHDGVVEVVYVAGTAGAPVLYHRRWDGSRFVAIGGSDREVLASGNVVANTPSIAATSIVRILRRTFSYSTQLDVFYLRKHGEPAHTVKASDRAPWVFDGMFFPDYPLLASPAAVSPYPNHLDVVWTTAGGVVGHLGEDLGSSCWTTAGCWSTPQDVMAGVASAPAISGGTRSLDVFAVQAVPSRLGPPSVHLLQATWLPLTGWGVPTPVVDCVHATPADETEAIGLGEVYSGPSAVATSVRTDLVMWGVDGNLWTDAYGFGVAGPAVQPPCGTCVSAGDACCGDTCMGARLACDATARCAACGGAGDACCAGNACDAGLGCDPTAHTCGCGGRDQPCCAGDACGGGLTCGTYDHVCGSGFTPTFDLLRTSCADGCHHHVWEDAITAYAHDPVASEHDAYVATVGLVTPGVPATSILYQRATSTSATPPFGMASYLPADPTLRSNLQQVIQRWIEGGARER